MYKVGDKFKSKNGSYNGILCITEIYFHDGVKQNVAILSDAQDGQQKEHRVLADIPLYWTLIRFKPPKDDIEWLDRVKENFKNG